MLIVNGVVGYVVCGFTNAFDIVSTNVADADNVFCRKEETVNKLLEIEQVMDDKTADGFVRHVIEQDGLVPVVVIDVGI